MEYPFFSTTTARAEALRWLSIAEKLLTARDLLGSRSFASRARDSDQTLVQADQILAIADTLLAADKQINNQPDWYSILQVPFQQHRDSEVIACQYRRFALLLNPQKNDFAFADQAFRLVVDAWSVLSNPSRKNHYDKEIGFYSNFNPVMAGPGWAREPLAGRQQPAFGNPAVDSQPGNTQPFFSPIPSLNPSPIHSPNPMSSEPSSSKAQQPVNSQPFFSSVSGPISGREGQVNKHNGDGGSGSGSGAVPIAATATTSNNAKEVGSKKVEVDEADKVPSFWTACPYCYYMYEYPRVYEDCTLRCQNCKRAFHAVVIPSPPPVLEGKEAYFCCWAFLPLGVSMTSLNKNKGRGSNWTPFSAMFTCPQNAGNNGDRMYSNNAGNQNVSNAGVFSAGGNKNVSGRKSSAPRIYVDDNDAFVEVSESSEESDEDWRSNNNKKKKVKGVKAKGSKTGTPSKNIKKSQAEKAKKVQGNGGENPQTVFIAEESVRMPNTLVTESTKKSTVHNTRRQPGRAAKDVGKLDLNVEFSNEVEEPTHRAAGIHQGNETARGEEDNIEGNGFFEGLDEFLSSLPILNVVGDDKVKAA